MSVLAVALWNERELCPPPSYTHKTSKDNKPFVELRSVCMRALSVLTDLDGLHNEGAVLSRVIYHLKCKLRGEKSFKAVEKVNRSLRRYLGLNMANLYSIFTPRDPDRTEMQGYRPSRQMLEFVLVRTQSFAQIFKHIANMCEEAGRELGMKLAVGHMWNASLVLYAIISRIWAYARYLVFSSCEWFNKLKMFLEVLLPNPTPWLPNGYSFPSDLASWLNIGTWTEASRPTLVPHTQHLFDLIASRDDDEIGFVLESESEDESQNCKVATNRKENIFDVDVKRTVELTGQEVVTKKVKNINLKKKKKIKLKSDVANSYRTVNTVTQNGDSPEQNIQDLDSAVETVTSHLNNLNTVCAEEDLGESVCRETVASRNNGKNSSEGEPQSLDGKKRSIKAISSHRELSALIHRESHLRGSQHTMCLTHSLDKLRWRLLRKALRKYVRKLEQETNKTQYKKLLVEAKQILRHHVL